MKQLFIKAFFILILAQTASLYSEINNYIVNINITLNSEFEETYLQIADYYKNEGLEKQAESIYSILDECIVQGFVYVDSDDTNFIITSSSYIEYSESIDIKPLTPKEKLQLIKIA